MHPKKLLQLFIAFVLVTVNISIAQSIEVTPEQGLNSALTFANGGSASELVLTDDTKPYYMDPDSIMVPLIIRAKEGLTGKPQVILKNGESGRFLWVRNDLHLKGIEFNGYDAANSSYAAVKYFIQYSSTIGFTNEEADLTVEDCHILNIYRDGDPEFSADGTIFDVAKEASAGDVVFLNTTLENTGDEAIRAINTHKEPVHPTGSAYNSLTVKNCTFVGIRGTSVKIESDGDASTADAPVLLENLTFYGCQQRVIWERDHENTVIRNLIIANSIEGNDTWEGALALVTLQRLGSTVSHVDTFNIKKATATDTVTLAYGAFVPETGTNTNAQELPTVVSSTISGYDPMFEDPENGNFTLKQGSLLYTLGHDGGPLGDKRWATNSPAVVENKISVTPDQDFNAAIAFANQGNANIIELTDDTTPYYLNPDSIEVPLTIRAAEGLSVKPKVILKNGESDRFLWVRNDLHLKGIEFNGYDAANTSYAAVKYFLQLSSTIGFVNEDPDLVVEDCHIVNIYRDGDPEFSTDGTIFDVAKEASAGDVRFERTTLENTGDEAIRAINTHKDPVHPSGSAYNSLTVKNCTFVNIRGTGVKIESDGDSLTVDAPVLLENLTFYGCQQRVIWERDHENTIIRNLIIANSIEGNDTWEGARALVTFQRAGSFVTNVDTFAIRKATATDTVDLAYGAFVPETGTNTNAQKLGIVNESKIWGLDPQFADPENGDFTLPSNSFLRTLGHDGDALGDRRWTGLDNIISVNDDIIAEIPTEFELKQNYPNPFNPSTTIEFNIAESGKYKLKVFNVLGQEVATLVDAELTAGTHKVKFDASRLASGVYIYSLVGKGQILSKKTLYMK